MLHLSLVSLVYNTGAQLTFSGKVLQDCALHGQLVKIGVQKGEHPLGKCTLFTMRHDGNQDVKAKLGSRTCCGSSGCRDYQDVRRKDIGSKQDVKAQLGSRSCELGDPGGHGWPKVGVHG
jgi:hypothetical protein